MFDEILNRSFIYFIGFYDSKYFSGLEIVNGYEDSFVYVVRGRWGFVYFYWFGGNLLLLYFI